MNAALEEQVRQRAYEIWVDLGKSDGHAHEHWIAAERAILKEVPLKPKAKKAVVKAAPKSAKPVVMKTIRKAAPAEASA